MPRRKRADLPQEVIGAIALVLLVVSGTVYSNLSAEGQRYLIAAGASLLVLLVILGILHAARSEQRRKEKIRALNMVDIDSMSGLDFERYLVEIFRSRGYSDVRLTETYDLGVDIIAVKDGVKWGVQAKRYKSPVKAAAVRQVVTALNQYYCQRAMVVTNSSYTRPAKVLAESNNCVLVDGEMLAEWIVEFQRSGETS